MSFDPAELMRQASLAAENIVAFFFFSAAVM
jgi:hypothetical protein